MKQIVVWLTKILSRVEAMCAEKADKIINNKLYISAIRVRGALIL